MVAHEKTAYEELLALMKEIFRPEAAKKWYERQIPALGNRTPRELVEEGNLEKPLQVLRAFLGTGEMKRTMKWWAYDDDVIVKVRFKIEETGGWHEDRVMLTRKDIAKLAKEFPIQSPIHLATK